MNQWEQALIDIIRRGYTPYDLHGENVMICSQTGNIKIVDVGLFKKHFQDSEDIDSFKTRNTDYQLTSETTERRLKTYISENVLNT